MNTVLINKSLFFSLKKIGKFAKLVAALRHNRREIQNELGAYSHIDSEKIKLNYSLVGSISVKEITQKVQDLIAAYTAFICKKIRHDATIAIEALFSLPSECEGIDVNKYLEDCFVWTIKEFGKESILSADVHLDEGNPHLHVIICCVQPNSLMGAKFMKFGKYFHDRNTDFFEQVAQKHGIQRPPPQLTKRQSNLLKTDVLHKLEQTKDPLLKSPCLNVIRKNIESNPAAYAIQLGMTIDVSPTRLRTVAEIMTAKGKGKRRENK